MSSLHSILASPLLIEALCCLGIAVCLYAIDIEKGGKKPKYKRVCDVNESMSCTLVLTSKYGHMAKLLLGLDDKSLFNRSNAEYGLLFYIGLLAFQFYPWTSLTWHPLLFFIGTLAAVLASIGLAGILYFVLHNFCMICVCMYLINSALFAAAAIRLIG